eukprot:TRINITY_DN3648_c0_g1_i1.p1 TRINITY_DN3648_c0_g1~~TRINITY_DN3648_c0_g1_i1.p1  ORF type:complete len:100 (+),score=13.73 TRINITY_DN3648_c0_g1_i1:71-370(+)
MLIICYVYRYHLFLSSFDFFFFLMIRRPPRSTLSSSSAASDVYKRQVNVYIILVACTQTNSLKTDCAVCQHSRTIFINISPYSALIPCLLYTSPSPRDS